MKSLNGLKSIAAFITLSTLASNVSHAKDCSVHVHGFSLHYEKVAALLAAKGYTASQDSNNNLSSADYIGPHGEWIKVINLFEHNNPSRIASKEVTFSLLGSIFGRARKVESQFLKQLPDCHSED